MKGYDVERARREKEGWIEYLIKQETPRQAIERDIRWNKMSGKAIAQKHGISVGKVNEIADEYFEKHGYDFSI